MPTTVEKYVLLVKRLMDRTDRNLLTWEWVDILDEVQCFLGGKTIAIEHLQNTRGNPLVRIIIRDEKGETVESFNDETLGSLPMNDARFDGYFSMMVALFDSAKRKATGADKALDDILSDLEDLEPF